MKKGLVRCLPVKCPEPEDACEVPVFPPGGCCPVCPSKYLIFDNIMKFYIHIFYI